VPLGLYLIFKKQTDEKIAFLSIFYFMSLFTFYTEMLSLAKQQMAEIFYMLLICVMLNKDMDSFKGKALYIVFGIGIVMSHYGTTYLYMLFSLVAFSIMVYILKHKSKVFAQGAILLFIVFGLSWYMYTSSSSAFDTIVHTGDHIASSIYIEFLNPEASQALAILTRETISPLHKISTILYYVSQFFILIGITELVISVLKREEIKFDKEFVAFSIMSFGVFLACVFVPHFTHMNIHRMYHTLMFFLAPFCVIGGITVFRVLSRIVRVSWTEQRKKSSLKVLSVFLVIFLLFNSGFVYEVAKDQPGSISLSQESVKEEGDAKAKNAFYAAYYLHGDIAGVKWISKNRDEESKVYADFTRKTLVFRSYGMMPGERVLTNTTKVQEGSYIYLGYPNVHYGLMYGGLRKYWDLTGISPLLDEMSMIYSNGDVQVYYR
jgi:uncharacterized membrane protein